MKKLVFPVLLGAFTLASCNKTETQTEQADLATEQTYVPDSLSLSPNKERVNAADSSDPNDTLRTGDIQQTPQDSAQ